jgi:hypothetical protein
MASSPAKPAMPISRNPAPAMSEKSFMWISRFGCRYGMDRARAASCPKRRDQ